MSTWAYSARSVVLPENAQYLSADWTQENVSSKGPFGEFYRVWGDGKQMVPGDIFDFFHLSGFTQQQLRDMGYIAWTPPQEKGSWISEGDTPTYVNLIDNGLRSHEHPGRGGWGGRLAQNPDDPSHWSGAGVADRDPQGNTPRDYSAQRFFASAQHDFAARMQWSGDAHLRGRQPRAGGLGQRRPRTSGRAAGRRSGCEPRRATRTATR